MNIIKLAEATHGKPVWVVRNTECYAIYPTRRTAQQRKFCDVIAWFCIGEFERYAGLKLKTDDCVRVRFGVMPV